MWQLWALRGLLEWGGFVSISFFKPTVAKNEA